MIAVNGTEITEDAIRREMQHHPASSREKAHTEATTALVIRALLLQEAERRGLTAAPQEDETDEESLVRQLLEQDIKTPEPDDETCRRFYDNNQEKLRGADSFRAAHILFPAAPSDPDARAAAKVRAKEIIAELGDDTSRFAALAREQSSCPSAAEGGDLGLLGRGQTVPEFETFLYNLEPGQISPSPVPTRFGYHVLWLKTRELGPALDFEAARQQIADYLKESSWRRAVHQYVQILAGQARIEGIDIGAATSPLVQ